jgi:hypothetical protein
LRSRKRRTHSAAVASLGAIACLHPRGRSLEIHAIGSIRKPTISSLAQRHASARSHAKRRAVRTAIEMKRYAPRPGPPHATHASPLSPAVTSHDTQAAQPVVCVVLFGLVSLFERDLVRKPVPTFRDHALYLSTILSENRYPLFGIMLCI